VEKEKIQIKGFKDGSSFYWVGNKVYHLNKQNEIEFICGGEKDEKEVEELKSFCKRNRKTFKEREPSIFEQEQKEYLVMTYGKYNGKPLNEIVEIDKRYARWIYDNSADKNIKEQLKELLKIK
jgi:hypothetical protein